MKKFNELELAEELIQVTAELGYEFLTEIQEKSIPLILQGRDVIGQSKTGSGKTAAFSLPLLHRLMQDERPRALKGLILCPTRELCTQVAREVRRLGRKLSGLQVLEVVGGQPLESQVSALEKGVDIVVGTPGRVVDHLTRGTILLEDIEMVILDEADRMLDMGFQDEVETILRELPETRQMILFSATFPAEIEVISARFQSNQVRVTVADIDQGQPAIAPTTIDQFYAILRGFPESQEARVEKKAEALIELLSELKPESSVVFCNFKINVAQVQLTLTESGISCGVLHGDLEQNERDRMMAQFRNKSIRVLIATDVAARGIDVDDLECVFNFDIPQKSENYIHRIGRTGRAGKNGYAINLVFESELNKITELEEQYQFKMKEQPLEGKTGIRFPYPALMRTLYISGGRKDKMRPGDILGALTGEAGGFQGVQIGKIEIHDYFSYVAVQTDIATQALKRLQSGRIKGKKYRVEFIKS